MQEIGMGLHSSPTLKTSGFPAAHSMNVSLQLVTGKDTQAPATVFDAFVGQEAAIKKLQFFLSASGPNMPVFPTLLFTGSHGLGKTYLAQKVAENMHRRFVELNAATIESGSDFLNKVILDRIAGDTPVTVLMDEAHALHGEVTDMLLTVLSPNKDGKNHIRAGKCEYEYDMSKINMILATTDAFSMFNALVNRTERIYFESYSAYDLLNMLKLYLPDVVLACNVKELTDACRGRGRDTFRLAQHIQRFCKIQNQKVFDQIDWKELKGILEIYPLGLNKQEVEVLRQIGINGPMSATNLAASMMIGEGALTVELETRLRELNLLTTSSKGRVLTDEGRKYWDEHISLINV